ncbi:salicylate hydroxylase [Talaromyces proteolyticus]|uniref:Salicylate hydroxylase n=1 Tax=Talaromyces proteolyticus TaxID=1131652 RepID=A0AAD4KZ24_9EURO|nr:salicylate hydroxylase [Talaromyces proteolyticus]KAH8700691.1 salicylate hydroxylase [Talaromyces proteolyticus]
MPSHPRIAIVGGGPAGLTMGVLLYKHGIPFTIFELREQPTEEELAKPSGMLDLHAESGLAVIKECGLYDHFIPLTGECAEVFIVADRNGNILATDTADGARPEISRHNLTKLLLDNIPAESIKWHHRLLSATKLATPSDTETELDFGTHGKYTFDLVIGADGAWSKVRKLLTNTMPQYSGTLNITITIKDITKKYPHLANILGPGSFSSLGNRHVIISQRGPIDSSRVYLWLTHPDENFATSYDLAGKPATNAKDKLLSDDTLLGTFGNTIKELVATACDEETIDNPGASLDIRALYKLPHGSSWEHKTGVTLVGDAAHLMLPSGEGVNLAMNDSLLLAHTIIKAYETSGNDTDSFQSTLDPLLKEFETALVERAKQAGDETDTLLEKMFGSDDAAHDLARLFQSAVQQQQG